MTLPTSFRIFRAGANTSTKGTVIFDSKAAEAVMQDYAQHGADLMMDLEHLSLNKQLPTYNPNAMAWFKLQLRGGELWATDVRYTPEGAKRLSEKSQRYISPFFLVDKATKRVMQIINSALTALPATDKPMALVAASQNTALMAFSTIGNPTMDLSPLIQLLGLPPDATLDDIVAAIKALQQGGGEGEPAAPAAAPVANSEAGNGGATAAEAGGSGTNSTNGMLPAPGPKKTVVSIQHSQDASAQAVIELSRQVAELQADKINARRDALIKANASKLTPTLEAWARTQTVENLTAFFKVATPTVETVETEPTREATALSRGGSGEISLTAEELSVCKATGVSPEAALAYKKGNK